MRSALFGMLIFSTAAAAESPSLDWVEGYWLSCEGGRSVAEAWMTDGTGVLVGMNQSAGSFEHLRISETESGLVYFASPGGAPATAFALVEHADRRVVFENPAHDFPQRVIYERQGDRLHARIEGKSAGAPESAQWTFRLKPMGEDCR